MKQLSLLISLFFVTSAYAEFKHTQLTVHTGMVNGAYNNPAANNSSDETSTSGASNVSNTEGGFSVMPSLSLNLELFQSSRVSYVIKTIIAMDSATGKMMYNFLGGGKNYYFKSIGILKPYSDDQVVLKRNKNWRYYYGWDIGLSRVIAASFGSVLNAVSTGLDAGGHIGGIKKLGDTWGLNVEFGFSFAYGFSTVAVTGTNMKILFGGTYSF